MNKTKFLTLTILLLFIINIVTLVFFMTKGPKDKMLPRKLPMAIIIEKLHFDTHQIAAYEKLISLHRKKIDEKDKTIKNLKNELYKQLANPENKTKIDSLVNQIALQQSTIEKIHFNHFLDIKKICKQDQLKDFNDLTQELSRIFSKPKHKNDKR